MTRFEKSDTEEDNTIQSLVVGGILGTAIGALLAKDKEEGAIIGAIIGAAVSATQNAYREAQKTNVPFLVEENGNIYEISQGGKKRFVKSLPKNSQRYPQRFTLK